MVELMQIAVGSDWLQPVLFSVYCSVETRGPREEQASDLAGWSMLFR